MFWHWHKIGQFWRKDSIFSLKIAKTFALTRAGNFEKVYCKGMIFHGNSLHCKGPILEAKFWAERMLLLRSTAPSRDLTLPYQHYFRISQLRLGLGKKGILLKHLFRFSDLWPSEGQYLQSKRLNKGLIDKSDKN